MIELAIAAIAISSASILLSIFAEYKKYKTKKDEEKWAREREEWIRKRDARARERDAQ